MNFITRHYITASSRRSGSVAWKRAFTLVELLVVIAVIALIVGMAVPALEPMMKGSKLTTASDDLRFTLNAYRQQAIAENKPIEIRFLKFIDTSSPSRHEAFRAFVAGRFRQQKDAEGGGRFVFEPIGNIRKLPDGVVLSSQERMSSLLASPKVRRGTHELPVQGQTEVPFVSFTFRPDGSTDLPKRAGDIWFVTIVQERDDENANTNPDNFVTLCIDAFNGAIRPYMR